MFCPGFLRRIDECFGKGKFHHDFPLLIGDFHDRGENKPLIAAGFEDFPDRCPRNMPGMIGIAKLLAFGIADQFIADTHVEEISRHG